MRELIESIQAVLTAGKVTGTEMQLMKTCLQGAVNRMQQSDLVKQEIPPGRYLCYTDDRYDFVVMLMSWAEGYESPIHNHSCWGLETVVKGQLQVTEYDEDEKNPKQTSQFNANVGDMIFQLPPKKDVHKVKNAADGLTYSIHVYGRQMCNNLMFKEGVGYVPCQLQTKDISEVLNIFDVVA